MLTTRRQGDLGELSAMEWLGFAGAHVAVPVGHTPDWDLIAELDGRLLRVQVKTSACFRNGRWEITLCTRGGNQSWNGISKRLDPLRCDYVFVLVDDGRRWFIPSQQLGGGSKVLLGGPKYAAFEVEPGRPLRARTRLDQGSTLSLANARGDVRVVKGDGL